ncbi:MAG: hypothetical protein JEZ03_07405 [Bacteroidales bacterium]|nr:hypothetical protein [Bacteroidales bacterium]
MKRIVLLVAVLGLLTTSCTMKNYSMKQPNNYIEFTKNDFTFSNLKTAEATSTRILGIDFERLFNTQDGVVEGAFSLPIVGNLSKGTVNSYALYQLMKENEGFDIIIYPQYEKQTTGIPFLYSTTTVKVKAKLGKIK